METILLFKTKTTTLSSVLILTSIFLCVFQNSIWIWFAKKMMDESEDVVENLLTDYAIQLSIQESNAAKPRMSSFSDRYCECRGYAIILVFWVTDI